MSTPLLIRARKVLDLGERMGARSTKPHNVYNVLEELILALEAAEDRRKGIAPPKPRPTHRHLKTGKEYVLIGTGRMQTKTWIQYAKAHEAPGSFATLEKLYADNALVALYQSVDDGEYWVRPLDEFRDGRFETL